MRVPYSPFFLSQVRSGNVKEITSVGTAIQGTFEKPTTYGGAKPTTGFETEVPAFADTVSLSQLLETNGVVVNAKPLSTGAPWWQTLLVGFGPTLLFLGLLFLLLRRAGGMQNALSSFGRSRARRYAPSGDRVTFADVAGIDEAKAELSEVVDFLRHPEKYGRLGGRIPHGVLLAGPPGTGKTLLARAVAGEADVPFFSMAASEFVEAIVGVGAARVRDLFVQAKAVVAVDRVHRRARRDRPLTHRGHRRLQRRQRRARADAEPDPDRDGRVRLVDRRDRDRGDQPSRRARFRHCCGRAGSIAAWRCSHPTETGARDPRGAHARGAGRPDVDLGRIAATTPGMVGADLANLVNEAALLAARREHEQVEEADFTDALERIVLGAERQVMMSEADRRRTAYHEAGHAVVGMLTPGADPVRKISIIPRGVALGVTFSAPDADRFNYEYGTSCWPHRRRAWRPCRRGGGVRRASPRARSRTSSS